MGASICRFAYGERKGGDGGHVKIVPMNGAECERFLAGAGDLIDHSVWAG